ncbi:hypothetical protein C0J45_3230, partial [Silurus meridionalis]
MKLLTLGFMLQGSWCLAFGEVVDSFKVSCPDFFIEDPSDQNVHYPPTVLIDSQNPNRYKQICQKWRDSYRYATLYDTEGRIPVYSAYYYVGYHKVHKAEWKIEPQLDDPNQQPEMAREGEEPIKDLGKFQAIYDDYASQSVYTRGHLYPRCHNNDQDCAIATYTHTNAVPQTQEDNNVWAHRVERKMEKLIAETCDRGFAHVVTGAAPGQTWMKIRRDNVPVENGVNIPEYFWTAYCCHDKTKPNDLQSGAWFGNVLKNKLVVRKVTVEQLEQELSSLYGKPEQEFRFQVFGGLCQGSKITTFIYNLI